MENHNNSPRFGLKLLFILPMFLTGCGSGSAGLLPVSGKITYQGKPVPNATVIFTPEMGAPGIGITDGSGYYTLKTATENGVTKGQCKVSISADQADPNAKSDMTPEEYQKLIASGQSIPVQSKKLVPERYASPATSRLSVTVGPETSFDFDLQD